MKQELVSLRNVSVQYGRIAALDDISLSIEDGDFLGIIGPNGGGKTTLLKVVLGLITPDHGTVTVMGRQPTQSRLHIGYVPQHNIFDMDFPINVRDTVLMGRYGKTGLLRRYSQQDRQAVSEALEEVGMLQAQHRQLGRLSGGEQQRVFIARALVGEPKLLLLDEPTASVDAAAQTDFYELLSRLKKRMAVVLVSHDISAISVHVDDIACLNHQLVYHGSKEISDEVLEATYKCPVQMIAHGTVPHRVLKEHD